MHAMLDPAEMRRQLRHWIVSDIHTQFGTSSLTGGPVGQWYSVNDYAMTRLVRDYVRFTGDVGFLDERAESTAATRPGRRPPVRGRGPGRGFAARAPLADYGEIDNLLECVSSYTHEVASLNAANVWNLRMAADVLELRGDTAGAAQLRAEADELLVEVHDALPATATGFFAAGQPDGTTHPGAALLRLQHRRHHDRGRPRPATIRAEMVAFFQRELQTPNWMRALSPWDPDASYSVRPDHQWNGAYPPGRPMPARSLIALGSRRMSPSTGSPGLARSANQGPAGQAHFVEEAQPLHQRRCAQGSAAAAVHQRLGLLVVGRLGRARPRVACSAPCVGLDGTVTADGCVAELDPDADPDRVCGSAIASYTIHADGRVNDANDRAPPTARRRPSRGAVEIRGAVEVERTARGLLSASPAGWRPASQIPDDFMARVGVAERRHPARVPHRGDDDRTRCPRDEDDRERDRIRCRPRRYELVVDGALVRGRASVAG